MAQESPKYRSYEERRKHLEQMCATQIAILRYYDPSNHLKRAGEFHAALKRIFAEQSEASIETMENLINDYKITIHQVRSAQPELEQQEEVRKRFDDLEQLSTSPLLS